MVILYFAQNIRNNYPEFQVIAYSGPPLLQPEISAGVRSTRGIRKQVPAEMAHTVPPVAGISPIPLVLTDPETSFRATHLKSFAIWGDIGRFQIPFVKQAGNHSHALFEHNESIILNASWYENVKKTAAGPGCCTRPSCGTWLEHKRDRDVCWIWNAEGTRRETITRNGRGNLNSAVALPKKYKNSLHCLFAVLCINESGGRMDE